MVADVTIRESNRVAATAMMIGDQSGFLGG
jgi:hypothetical protein